MALPRGGVRLDRALDLTRDGFTLLVMGLYWAEGACVQPWFVAKDICVLLGISNSRQATASSAPEEKAVISTDTPGGQQQMNGVSGSGLYKLIMRSNKPVAKPFPDWETKAVLPAIRKDGEPVSGEEKVSSGEMSEDELILKAAA